MNMLEEINKLDNDSSIEDIMKVVECDLKDTTKVKDIQDPIEKFFKWKYPRGNDLEKHVSNEEMYTQLDWINMTINNIDSKENINYYDIINSFQGIYVLGLKIYYPENFSNMVENFKWKVDNETFEIKDGKFIEKPDNYNYNQQRLNSSKFLYNTYAQYSGLNNLLDIKDFAILTHSIGNFMPCPDSSFNSKKQGYSDLLDIFYIELESKYSKDDEAKELKDWLDNNESKIFINNYIEFPIIKSVSDLNEINKDEYNIFVNKIVTRIRIRGLQIIQSINGCQNVKVECSEEIKKLQSIMK